MQKKHKKHIGKNKREL